MTVLPFGVKNGAKADYLDSFEYFLNTCWLLFGGVCYLNTFLIPFKRQIT